MMKGRYCMLAVLFTMISAATSIASVESVGADCSPRLHRRPVVLVHGFKDTSRKMQQMAAALRREGWTVYTPTLTPSLGQVGLDELARQLAVFIDGTLRPGEKFDLVGFSMGGLVCRYYLQRMDGLSRTDKFITLGAPHHGSLWACLIANPGCRQMRPGSDFIKDLNSDIDTLRTVDFTSVWTPLDLMILPSSSSRMPVGREIELPLLLHPLLVLSPRSIDSVVALLK